MNKLDIKGGREKTNPEQDVREKAKIDPEAEGKPRGKISAEALQKAWEKLESYKPLTREALEEVLEEFLEGHK